MKTKLLFTTRQTGRTTRMLLDVFNVVEATAQKQPNVEYCVVCRGALGTKELEKRFKTLAGDVALDGTERVKFVPSTSFGRDSAKDIIDAAFARKPLNNCYYFIDHDVIYSWYRHVLDLFSRYNDKLNPLTDWLSEKPDSKEMWYIEPPTDIDQDFKNVQGDNTVSDTTTNVPS